MKALGKFVDYVPTEAEMADLIEGVNYLRNEDGVDWYSISWDKARTAKNVYVLTADNGDVACATDRGKMLFPQGLTVYELDKELAPEGLLGAPYWKVVDGGLVAPNMNLINANTEKYERLREAEKAIVLLSRAVRLNMATDDDKAQLEAWEKYSVLLNRVNTAKAVKAKWPAIPTGKI